MTFLTVLYVGMALRVYVWILMDDDASDHHWSLYLWIGTLSLVWPLMFLAGLMADDLAKRWSK